MVLKSPRQHDSKNNKLKVLLVGPTSPPFGGLETYIETLLDSPLKERFRIIHLDTRKKLRSAASKGRFDLFNAAYGLWRLLELVLLFLRHRPDVMHIPITSTSSGFLRDGIFLRAARPFVPLIIGHVHGGDFDLFVRTAGARKRKFIDRTLDKPDILIALSGYWRSFFEGMGVSTAIEVLPNGIPRSFIDYFDRPAPTERQSGGSVSAERKKPVTILFFGSIGQRKGAFDLLRAASIILESGAAETRFHFVGSEERPGEMDKFNRMLGEFSLSGTVEVSEPRFGEKKMQSFRNADIFVLPTRYDAFPIALLEALAAGLPVVTTPVGSIPEIVNHGENALVVEPGKPTELADALSGLILDPDRRSRMGAANRKLAKEKFGIDSILPALERFYMRKSGK